MNNFKFITYYSDVFDEIPIELINYLENNRINYIVFPSDTTYSEVLSIVTTYLNKRDIFFSVPERALFRLKNAEEIKEIPKMGSFYSDDTIKNYDGVIYPSSCCSDAGIATVSDIIYACMVRDQLWKNKWKQRERSLYQ